MNTGSALPMPKMNSASGIQAMPEIGRSISTVGSISVVDRAVQPHHQPERNGQQRRRSRGCTSIRAEADGGAARRARGCARAPTIASKATSGEGSRIGLRRPPRDQPPTRATNTSHRAHVDEHRAGARHRSRRQQPAARGVVRRRVLADDSARTAECGEFPSPREGGPRVGRARSGRRVGECMRLHVSDDHRPLSNAVLLDCERRNDALTVRSSPRTRAATPARRAASTASTAPCRASTRAVAVRERPHAPRLQDVARRGGRVDDDRGARDARSRAASRRRTRERVEAVLRQTGYTPDLTASALASQRSRAGGRDRARCSPTR